MSLYSALKGKGPTGFGYGSTAEEVTSGVSLDGKTVLLTGCNSGLGLETLRVLHLRGAHVLGAARTEVKATEAAASVGASDQRFTALACELSEPESIRACVERVRALGVALDVVVANAGIMALPELEIVHGVEKQLFTNHLGHFMLVTGLLDRLAADARVVVVSSDAHKSAPRGGIDFENLDGRRGYSPWTFYGQSKIANILFAKELARRFAGTERVANALHPGVIKTNLTRSMNPVAGLALALAAPLALKSIPEGAATQCYLAANPAAARVTGEYLSHCNVAAPRREAEDAELAKRLWEKSESVVAAV